MKKNKINIGPCHLCGVHTELTFEHSPPKAAFNKNPIFMQGHEQLFETASPLFGKSSKSQRGFGGFTLCKSCNNNTGDWYAQDYTNFAQQGMGVLQSVAANSKNPTAPKWVEATYRIKPLNVLKQALVMFTTADKAGVFREDMGLRNFILHRNSTALPKKYKIFMYHTLSKHSRQQGYAVVYDSGNINHWAEVSFKPFGFLLTIDSPPAHPLQLDITHFKNFRYECFVNTRLRMPYLNPASPMIGTYE